jgi:serine/threonine protein kinase
MEFAGGGDMLQLLKTAGKLTEKQARYYFYRLLLGVSAIHSAGVLHRDLKLDNILLDLKLEELKICDFGVSKAITPGETISGKCGTPAYIAPEILVD